MNYLFRLTFSSLVANLCFSRARMSSTQSSSVLPSNGEYNPRSPANPDSNSGMACFSLAFFLPLLPPAELPLKIKGKGLSHTNGSGKETQH